MLQRYQKKLTVLPINFPPMSAYIAFSKTTNTSIHVPIFNKALSGMIANGTYAKIYKKYSRIQSNKT